MAFVMKQDEAADPLQVRLLGTDAVMPDSNELMYLIQ